MPSISISTSTSIAIAIAIAIVTRRRGKEGTGEKRGNLLASPPTTGESPEEKWKRQREMIAEAIAARPTFSDKEIADIPLRDTGITKEMVRAYRQSVITNGAKPKRVRAETDAQINKRIPY